MFSSKAPKQQKSNVVPRKVTSPTATPRKLEVVPSHHEISKRAYALYERGGHQDGGDQRDWFDAEREMLVQCK